MENITNVSSTLSGIWCSLKTPSTSTITEAPTSCLSSYKITWQSWLEWQKKQNRVHFERSDVFKKYASDKSNEIPIHLKFRDDITYVLGDFKYFIPFDHIRNDNIFWDHIQVLINLYDCCKGVRRSIFGDSPFIIILRSCNNNKDISQLLKYNYDECRYDFETLHTHTVAYFSLSTLIMRITCHLLYLKYGSDTPLFPKINDLCFSDMYKQDCYGYNKENPINIHSFPHLKSSDSSKYLQRSNPMDIPKTYKSANYVRSEPRFSLPNSYNECPGCKKPTSNNKCCPECYNLKNDQIDFYNYCEANIKANKDLKMFKDSGDLEG